MTRKIYVKTYGCQMNAYDSARMADVMAPHGYQPTDLVDEADLIVLNTCHIREKAAEKVFSELGRLRPLRQAREKDGHRTLIAVAGCVAQAEGEEIQRRAPMVDIVVGPQAYHRLPELVARAEPGRRVADTEFPVEPKFDHLPAPAGQGPSAFLAVQEGCDKFCTFCVVPYTRGAEYSRPAAEILAEARALMAAGAVEITLLGQNVNAWRGDAPDGSAWGMGRLIRELAATGLARIRYTTSHPRDMDDDLIAAHAEVPALMPFLHLPVQAGSDRVLAAMNRGHRAEDYLRLVERIRAARPDIALSSDFIVGFPGETDEDFEETLALVRTVTYAQAYSFKYSRRPGTPAAAQRGQVREEIKAERLARLQELLNAQQIEFNRAHEGRVTEVLLDRPGRLPGQLLGRTPHGQAIHVAAPIAALGRIVPIRITQGLANSVAGVLLAPEEGGKGQAA